MTPQDQNHNENQPDPLENLLAQLPLTQPSPFLDHRIHALLTPQRNWRKLLIPLSSFAAGLFVATAIFLPLRAGNSSPLPLIPQAPSPAAYPIATAPTTPAPSDETPTITLVAEPHQSTEQLNATIDGTPVLLQRTRTQYTAYSPQSPSSNNLLLSDSYTLTQVAHY